MVSEPEFFLSFSLLLTLAVALFICRRRFSAPCSRHAGQHRGCCPPCSLEVIIKEAKDTEAQAAAARRRVQATALEQTATTARQRVPFSPSSASSLAAAPPLVYTASSTYEDTVVAGLHLQASAVLNVRQLVNIILDSSSTNYACCRDLMEQALQRYALLEHVTDDTPSTYPGWIRMDSVVLNWISNSILTDLHQVVRERGCTACHLWLTIENQFLGNCEHPTLHLDAAFCTFVQGDLSVNEYCRKFKSIADGLADLGAPVDDRILVLNILRGLNQRFEHVGSIIWRYSPFPNFLKVRDDLLLEELHMGSTGPTVASTTLYTNIASPTAKPPSSTPSRWLGPTVVGQLFQLHGASPVSYLGPGLGGGLRRDTPYHSISW
jgi:hypothetical protein